MTINQTQGMKLEIELGGNWNSKTHKIHKAGCRDLQEPFPIGTFSSQTEALKVVGNLGSNFERDIASGAVKFSPCCLPALSA